MRDTFELGRSVRFRMRARRSMALLLLAALLAAACSSGDDGSDSAESGDETSDESSSEPRTLRVALTDFGNENLDPAVEVGAVIANIHMNLYDSLLEIGPDGEIAPGIAESWEVADDNITWTFHLREGVQFHDDWGEVTAEDVEYSINRMANENGTNTASQDIPEVVDSIEVIDDYTLEIKTKGVQTNFEDLFANRQSEGGLIMSKDHLMSVGDDFAAQTELINENPVGSGPYQFVERTLGDRYVFEKVEDHWRVDPAFDRLEFLLVPEPATQVAMLLSNEADLIELTGDQIEQVESAGLDVLSVPNSINVAMQFAGTYRPAAEGKPTADPMVRRALSLAIDREGILASLAAGEGSLVSTPFSTLDTSANIDEAHFEDWAEEVNRYDPDEARELLADAGYPDGFDGINMHLFPRPGTPYLQQVGEAVASQWAEIGVDVSLVPLDFQQYRPHQVNADINDSFNAGDAAPYSIQNRFDSTGVLTTYFRYDGGVVQYTNDPEIDEGINEVLAEPDDERREGLVSELFDLINDQWVVLPLFNANSLYGANPEVIAGWSPIEGYPYLARSLESMEAAD